MVLEEVSFGDRVAENESAQLESYFVETQQWNSLISGKVDVVFGPKGSGKSALYTLLLKRQTLLAEQGKFLLSAEKPTGQTVFSDVSTSPPTSEREFETLWKLYICQLIIDWLCKYDLCKGKAEEVRDLLAKAELIEESNTLKRLVNGAMRGAQKLARRVEGVQGGLGPEGVTGGITLREPTSEQFRLGYRSVDDLLSMLNCHLQETGRGAWVLCDRLDVAFEQDLELEKNALRALFKAYLDIAEYEAISLKIFLRDDIWSRITKEGFREASHITKTATITWNDRNLLNLVVRRALMNPGILEHYLVEAEDILIDHDKQLELYYKMFPEQVDVGEKQSATFHWVLSRIRDGLNNAPPRELIHYYNETITQECQEQDMGNDKIEVPNIVSRNAIKLAAYEVSKVRTEQTIFAEYADLKPFIMALENKKAEHTAGTLSLIWGISEEEAQSNANRLAEIGFFEQRTAKEDKIFKIPFVYRFYLGVTQGKAF